MSLKGSFDGNIIIQKAFKISWNFMELGSMEGLFLKFERKVA